MGSEQIARRAVLRLLAAGAAASVAACGDDKPWHDVNVTGTSPSLQVTMRRAPDGRRVTQADFRGDIVLLYFGYTFCPDVCPLTMQHTGDVLTRMGADASAVKVLFVTVDPVRDTLAQLGRYVALFGPNFVGLRGDPDQIASLARRFRIAYSVDPGTNGSEDVTHSSAIYAFDRRGRARLLVPSLASTTPDVAGVADDLTRLVRERSAGGLA